MSFSFLKNIFSNSNKKQVLLVSETKGEVEALAVFLASMGYRVKYAGSQTEAVHLLQGRSRFSFMVMGSRIHGVGGVAVVKALREEEGQGRLPTVLMVEKQKAGDSAVLREHLPRTGLLSRPFSTESIFKAIASATVGNVASLP